jgi:hypothetical protein
MEVGDALGGLAPQAVHVPELCRVGAVIEDVVWAFVSRSLKRCPGFREERLRERLI